MSIRTITQPRSEIADTLTAAVAKVTGLKPEQITSIDAGPDYIEIGYTGPMPGMAGASGRKARQTWDTETGKLISDQATA